MKKESFRAILTGKGFPAAACCLLALLPAGLCNGNTTLIGPFEPGDDPTTNSAFTPTSLGKIVQGGTTDVDFGAVPAATQGTHVYGVSWTSPGGGDGQSVEINSQFAVPASMTGKTGFLVDVYASSGTTVSIGMGVWLSQSSTWLPESTSIGLNDQWVTLLIPMSGLTGTRDDMNLAFKRVGGSGQIFLDNLRLLDQVNESVAGSFEPNDTPTTITPFNPPSGLIGKTVQGGSSDVDLGSVPSATQGSYVYGLTWTAPGSGDTVEVNCKYETPIAVASDDLLLLDAYATAGTAAEIGIGTWWPNVSVWRPEALGVGVTGTWVTIAIPMTGVSGMQDEFNFGIKRVTGSGTLFFDNMRIVSSNVPVSLSVLEISALLPETIAGNELAAILPGAAYRRAAPLFAREN